MGAAEKSPEEVLAELKAEALAEANEMLDREEAEAEALANAGAHSVTTRTGFNRSLVYMTAIGVPWVVLASMAETVLTMQDGFLDTIYMGAWAGIAGLYEPLTGKAKNAFEYYNALWIAVVWINWIIQFCFNRDRPIQSLFLALYPAVFPFVLGLVQGLNPWGYLLYGIGICIGPILVVIIVVGAILSAIFKYEDRS